MSARQKKKEIMVVAAVKQYLHTRLPTGQGVYGRDGAAMVEWFSSWLATQILDRLGRFIVFREQPR